MLQTIDVSKAREEFSSLLEKAYFTGQKFVVLRRGIPLGVIMGINEVKEMVKPETSVKTSGVTKLFGLWKGRKTSTVKIADDLRKLSWERHAG